MKNPFKKLLPLFSTLDLFCNKNSVLISILAGIKLNWRLPPKNKMRGKGLEGNPSLNWLGARLESDSRSYYQTLAQSNSKESTVFQEYFCSFYFTLSRNENKTKKKLGNSWLDTSGSKKIAKSYIIIKTHFWLLLAIRTLLVFSDTKKNKKLLQGLYSSLSRNTLLVSRSEHPRDKPFLLTMVSYLKEWIEI